MSDPVKNDKTKILSVTSIIEIWTLPNFTVYEEKNPAISRPLFNQN
jgi:hypothetical protein